MSSDYGSVPTNSSDENQHGAVAEIRNKQGHSCCLGCCDVRRAVIIVDLIMICFLLIDIFGIISLSRQEPYDDDELQSAVESIHGGIGIAVFLFEIVLLVVAVRGAITFSVPMVTVGLAVFGLGFIASLFQFNLPGMVITGFFAYPHYYLRYEIKAGIISAETYINEEQSCCCV
jgi:hypothetical protein